MLTPPVRGGMTLSPGQDGTDPTKEIQWDGSPKNVPPSPLLGSPLGLLPGLVHLVPPVP